MKDTLGAWSHAKTRPDIVNRRARRLYAEIARSGGVRNIERLARLCGMTADAVREDLELLTLAGLLKPPAGTNDDARQDEPTTREIRHGHHAAA